MARAETGIGEFDQMLGGGFMQNDVALVAGSAGSGKTTLALQFLVNGIRKFGENGIYVTFEELPDQIYRDALNFGWDLKKLEVENKLRIICTSPNLLTEFGDSGGLLDEPIERIDAKRMVIDSLSHLGLFVRGEDIRPEVYRLTMYLKRKGLTTLGLWETPQLIGQSFSVSDVGVSFLVDALVLLRFVEVQSEMKKAVAVLKIRGSDHDKRLRELKIASDGIRVEGPFTDLEGVMTGSPRRTTRTEEAVGRFGQAFTSKRKRP